MTAPSLAVLGLGSRSTLYYINQLNQLFQKKYGGYSTCPFTLLNTNFNLINPYLPNNFSKLIPQLSMYLNNIEKLDLSHLIIPNITLHECVDQINTNVTIIHPIHETAQKLHQNNQSNVLLIGSRHSMNSTYIRTVFNQNNILITIPNTEEISFIDELRVSIYNRTEKIDEIHAFQSLVSSYAKNMPVVIACTELSIPEQNTHNLYDMVDIQIENALGFVK
jgi:aspartate racemase